MSELTMWTVYEHPADYPDKFVAREWAVSAGAASPTDNVILTPDLETLREILLVDFGLYRLGRQEDDDPTIVESWV